MSVHVTIDIAGGNAYRELHISNMEVVRERRDPDDVHRYSVEARNSRSGQGGWSLIAQFEHRYGDDVGILITKACSAIREKYGIL